MPAFSAPAKLNLSLRVLGKRGDGFHEIDTLMVRLPGLADRLEIEDAENFGFTCDDPSLSAGESNLVVKAARAFQTATGLPAKHHITLRKTIPHGAGLGGGSSDAAATLLALNQLNGSPLDPSALSRLAAALGSDIPFFLSDGSARCTGRGEVVTPTGPIPPLHVLLLKPGFSVSTPDAYGRWENAVPLPGIDHAPRSFPWGTLVNDLEIPVFQKHRFLAELKQWLLGQNVAAALMSGSGSTVFAILRDPSEAPKIAAAAREELDSTLWTWAGHTG